MAKLNLEFTEVRAPIDGRVSRAMLTVGNLAVADQTLLTAMVSQDPVYVYFDPDEHSYLRYSAQARGGRARRNGADGARRPGQRGRLPARRHGRLSSTTRSIRRRERIRVRATLSNADRTFTPGLYARVQFASGKEARRS